jgi:hypothetical protein
VKIRYDSADPYMAVLEDEEWSSDHIDPRPNFIFWVGATTLVGLFAAYLAGPLATEEPLLAGALTGLLIAQVQWLVIFRYIYLLNWRWVLAGILGWMVYFKLIPFYGGILGAGIFSLILWLALRKSNQTTRWWFLFSFLGLVAAQWIRTALAPFTSNVISEGIFYLAYGAASGAGLLLNNDSTPTESKLPPLRSAQQMYPAGETNADQEIQDKSAEPSGSLEFESNYRKKGAEIFELIVNGKLVTKQPDENVIRETLLALQQQKKGFCILSQSELTYIQTAHRSSLGFNLEYQDGSLEDHYACTQAEILLEDVHKAFLLFLNQDEQLETLFTWERMQI